MKYGMSHSPAIVWFQQDLRLTDNPALSAAADRGQVAPVYIHAPEEEGEWGLGAASRYWLHQSLVALDASLQARGLRLALRRGPTLDALRTIAAETGARSVFWNRRHDPVGAAREAAVEQALRADGIETFPHVSALLFNPDRIRTQQGGPYKVFTQFWRACQASDEPPPPCAAPSSLRGPESWPHSEKIEALGLEPCVDWAAGIRGAWRFGEAAARDRLVCFRDEALERYATGRDAPAEELTSRLSPHLHFGELSVRQAWHTIQEAALHRPGNNIDVSAQRFLTELGWREFAHHLLIHFPNTPTQPLRPEFARFPWRRDPDRLCAWQRGQTGYPIVDAGMRELWATGWMHNRVRMIAASFLVKDLLLPWQEGARWFWDALVDADLANNTFGWQWSAGCGADAAPYFRIFNPVTQGERFDPQGRYVRRWVPELAALPDAHIHRPWEAPRDALARASITLGHDYPAPIIDHREARQEALLAFQRIRAMASAPQKLV